ncbi:MAG: hypothetical protein EA352_02695 [Gemmatimonadales bacterium]|nr:MAG: hypothetical protein EA352_02695 [Gemmatimonadales bacterium]
MTREDPIHTPSSTRKAPSIPPGADGLPDHLVDALDERVEALQAASALTRAEAVRRLLSQVDALTDSREGLELLRHRVPEMVEAGLFRDGPWEKPGRLVPALVGGTLRAGDQTTLMEILSELRILAVSEGRLALEEFPAAHAQQFLLDALVRDPELLFPEEEEPTEEPARKVRRLTDLLLEHIPMTRLKGALATEIALLCLQRPIVTDRALTLLERVRDRIPVQADEARVDEALPDDGDPEWEDTDPDRRLAAFLDAALTPSEAVRDYGAAEYAAHLKKAGAEVWSEECGRLGAALSATGLAIPHHALLARRVRNRPADLGRLLGLSATGQAELERHRAFVAELVDDAIHPDLPRAVYGLGRLLERGILSQQPVRTGLQRFLTVDLHPDAARAIRRSRPGAGISPRKLLLGDLLGVLGQPLGIGQGKNPTCQSARGLSLWSRHAPGKLLGMVRTVAESFDLVMRFEGQELVASQLGQGLVQEFDHDLDAVSVIMVPHLDRIYNEMMRRAAYRGDDPHRWVNPAMYGHWIPTGFSSAYDYATNTIPDFDGFVRQFFATHHPEWNGGHDLAYPNPVGIFLTSVSGDLIGFHAVSVLRVRKVKGQMRVFLYNPNGEGRQRWHADIRPTVAGNGERPGESSLPFHQFAARLYAFHYNPADVGPLEAVPAEEVTRVTELARSSWGRSYTWVGLPGGA